MRVPVAFLIMVLVALPASAEVFRCEIDGTIVFSDTACQPDARPYTSQAGISVISRPVDLDQTSERNREFIDQRLERQAETRKARAEQVRAAQQAQAHQSGPPPHAAARGSAAPIIYVPYRAPHRSDHGQHARHRPAAQAPAEQERRFSALSGPFPGTRRRSEP